MSVCVCVREREACFFQETLLPVCFGAGIRGWEALPMAKHVLHHETTSEGQKTGFIKMNSFNQQDIYHSF